MSSTTKIKERPILCKGPEVRALLRGATQLRRMLTKAHAKKLGLDTVGDVFVTGDGPYWDGTFDGGVIPWCPYGTPGDRLWVREAYGFCVTAKGYHAIRFKVDCAAYDILASDEGEGDCCGLGRPVKNLCDFGPQRWKPSIHMPRWASRILLELTDVRVQRLQDISEADIQAEGVPAHVAEITFRKCYRDSDERAAQRRKCFRELWDSINGPGSWDANPWVWALTFKRLEVANGR